MKRRHFLGSALAAGAIAPRAKSADLCGCSLFQAFAAPANNPAWEPVSSGVKITGMKVFGVSLTPDSDRPYVFVKLETDKGVIGWGEGTLEGLIRIGIIPTVAPYLVPQFVPHLRKTYPSVEVELREAVTDRLMADLLTGKLDAVIAALPLDIEGIQTRPLFTDRFFMAVADNGEAVLMSPLTEHEVNVDRLLLLEEGHCLRDQALAVCSAGKRSLVNFGATSMATLLQMVSHDMGMTLIPEMAIPTETSRNSIRIVPFADPQPSREIGLAWRRSNHRGKEMEALAEAIIAVAPAPHELAA